MKYDTTKVGDRVSWTGLNRTCHGTVREVTDQGLIVDVDGGGVMILSTTGPSSGPKLSSREQTHKPQDK